MRILTDHRVRVAGLRGMESVSGREPHSVADLAARVTGGHDDATARAGVDAGLVLLLNRDKLNTDARV